jgi:hypothetical protein
MNDGIVALAKMFKERDNKHYEGFLVGKVITSFPDIMVSINGEILLDKEDLLITEKVYISLENDDLVILIPSKDYQTYVVIDRLVNV